MNASTGTINPDLLDPYAPRVETAPRPDKLPSLEESEGYKPLSNQCDGDLMNAHDDFGVAAFKDVTDRLNRLAAKKSGAKIIEAGTKR